MDHFRQTRSDLFTMLALAKYYYFSLTLLIIVIVAFCSIPYFHAPSQSEPWRLSGNTPLNYHGTEQKQTAPQNTVRLYHGTVHHSFFTSALDQGLSAQQISFLVNSLKADFNFIDTPEENAVFSVAYANNHEKDFRAFYYRDKQRHFFALRFGNGHLYDEYGRLLEYESFLKYPTTRFYGISSGFNLHRLHPVTHKFAPHFGTDYRTPVGTPILSIGSGVVITSRYSRLAGNYIAIRHSDSIVTRYMHLSSRLVQVGQRVTKGQKIALSGNTGRTTGPHLHFELRLNNTPVDFEKYKNSLGEIRKRIVLNAHQRRDLNKEIHFYRRLLMKKTHSSEPVSFEYSVNNH